MRILLSYNSISWYLSARIQAWVWNIVPFPISSCCVTGITNLTFGCHTCSETEQERCRRSDGKKWRCSRNVVPHQKYCEIHMHRGAKRKSVAPDSVVVPPSKPSFCPPENDATGRNLNTSLSIYTIPGPQNTTDGDSNSNSTSDATTITDEIPAFVSR